MYLKGSNLQFKFNPIVGKVHARYVAFSRKHIGFLKYLNSKFRKAIR